MNQTTGYLKISNKGEIEVEAFRLIGASTKRDDTTKIGFFGSGLKYALAVLLREEIPFKVFSGSKEVKITTKPTTMRGTTFNVIYIDGKATSLTTDMGPTWEPWFCIREIFCNAIDEGNHKIGLAGEPTPVKDETVFYIGINDKTKNVLDNWNMYFSEKRDDMVHNAIDIKFYTGGQNSIIYRKGIQVYERNKQSLYHYDLNKVNINESRVISSDWEWQHDMCRLIAKKASVSVIENILMNFRNHIEEEFYWKYASHQFSNNWLTAIGDRHLVPSEYAGHLLEEMAGKNCILLPADWITALKATFGDKVKVIGSFDSDNDAVIKDPTPRQNIYIEEAVNFLRKSGFHIEHPIKICHFKNKHVLGRAKDDQILLSPMLFEMGKKMIVSVILEEESHLITGYGDNTRDMQNYLFSKIVSLMEEKQGVYL